MYCHLLYIRFVRLCKLEGWSRVLRVKVSWYRVRWRSCAARASAATRSARSCAGAPTGTAWSRTRAPPARTTTSASSAPATAIPPPTASTYQLVYTHTHTSIHTHAYIHMHTTHTHSHMHTYTLTHTYIHTRTLIHTHTHTHAHIHTYIGQVDRTRVSLCCTETNLSLVNKLCSKKYSKKWGMHVCNTWLVRSRTSTIHKPFMVNLQPLYLLGAWECFKNKISFKEKRILEYLHIQLEKKSKCRIIYFYVDNKVHCNYNFEKQKL